MTNEHKQPKRNTLNLAADRAIFLAFLVAMAPRFSRWTNAAAPSTPA